MAIFELKAQFNALWLCHEKYVTDLELAGPRSDDVDEAKRELQQACGKYIAKTDKIDSGYMEILNRMNGIEHAKAPPGLGIALRY